jgi:cytochrome c
MLRTGAFVAALAVAGAVLAETQLDPIEPRLATADAERGKTLFLQCRACHVAEPGKPATVGPNLWDIVGRPVGAQEGFAYSESLASIDGDWDFEKLGRYLFDPRAMAPGTNMIFPGIKPARDRADLIAYLATLSGDPVALPARPESPSGGGVRYGNLPEGEGREAVYFTCRACHALEQFTEERFSRGDWDALIGEMVDDHGMAAPEGWARDLMLDYLAVHFGEKPKQDWQGLPPGPGREAVFYACKTCHSLMLVTQQGMSRDRWDDTLVWMVEEQGMSEIDDADTRQLILDYLATHFGS